MSLELGCGGPCMTGTLGSEDWNPGLGLCLCVSPCWRNSVQLPIILCSPTTLFIGRKAFWSFQKSFCSNFLSDMKWVNGYHWGKIEFVARSVWYIGLVRFPGQISWLGHQTAFGCSLNFFACSPRPLNSYIFSHCNLPQGKKQMTVDRSYFKE